MNDLRTLEKGRGRGVLLDTTSFRKFKDLKIPRLDECRQPSLYRGPILLVRKSPPAGIRRIQCAVSLPDLAFNETYYGFTAHKQEAAANLVKYLCTVIGSKIALWHTLMTSGEFGFERDKIEKYVIQEVPMPPFGNLSAAELEEAVEHFDRLAKCDSDECWEDVDKFVARLFDLTADDIQTISDTLDYALPFAKNKKAARDQTDATLRNAYSNRLENELKPWGERYNRALTVQLVYRPPLSPWHFVAIRANANGSVAPQIDDTFMQAMQQAADTLSSSEIIYRDEQRDCLFVGRLNQARYWSISQARLVARRIIWEHVDFLSGKPAG